MVSNWLLATDDTGKGLRLSFEWHADRFRHTVAGVLGWRCPFPLLATIEGDDRSSWPPSPPLQQLMIEPRSAGSVALLVGMAGKSHWSASVESRNDPPRLLFDIACLARQSPIQLGSSYRVADPDWRRSAGGLVFRVPNAEFRLTTGESGGAASARLAFDEETASFALRARLPEEAFTTRTIRWQYRVELIG